MSGIFSNHNFIRSTVMITIGGAALGFLACSNETTATEDNEKIAYEVVESDADLSEIPCDTENGGKLLFVENSSIIHVCDGKNWISINNEDISKIDSVFIFDTLVKKDTIILNHIDSLVIRDTLVGLNGEKGDKGENGENCSAKALEDGSGYELVCGGKSVGTIKNGDKGDKGESCTAEELEDGSGYELVCGGTHVGTINKATCGTQAYNPQEKFCYNGLLYDYHCAGKAYNPTTEYCECNQIKKPSCNGETYNPLTNFCWNKKLYDNPSCNEVTYNPEVQYCKNAKTVTPFECFTDARDDHVYKSVVIGLYTWMAENLNYYSEEIKEGTRCPNNQSENCSIYGRLYSWYAADTLCPDGWTLPNLVAFEDFNTTIVGGENVPYKLTPTQIPVLNSNGWNSYGFGMYPTGTVIEQTAHDFSNSANWWFSSKNGVLAYYAIIYTQDFQNIQRLLRSEGSKTYYMAVRCVKK